MHVVHGRRKTQITLSGFMKQSRFAAFAASVVAVFAWPSAWAAPAQQAYVKPSNTPYASQFGYAVAVSGDLMVIGSRFESCSSSGVNGSQTNSSAGQVGSAYVLVRNGTNWVQEAYLKASNNTIGS